MINENSFNMLFHFATFCKKKLETSKTKVSKQEFIVCNLGLNASSIEI
jgi:hypothetical protein